MTTRQKTSLTVGLIAVIAAVVAFTIWWPQHQASIQADACIDNLRQIGLAGRMVAATNGDAFPRNFTELRPWIHPQALVCPRARGVVPTTWEEFDISRVTYEMVGAGMSQVTDYSNVFVMCPMHHFKCYGDGWAPPRYCKGQGTNE